MFTHAGPSGYHRDMHKVKVPKSAQFGIALNRDVEGTPQLDGAGHAGWRWRLIGGINRVTDVFGTFNL